MTHSTVQLRGSIRSSGPQLTGDTFRSSIGDFNQVNWNTLDAARQIYNRTSIWMFSGTIALRYLGPLNRVADVSCRRSAFSAMLWHQPSRCTTLQTFYGRRPSFSGCCRQDLKRTAGQSGLSDVTTDFPAQFEDISVSAFFSLALQWTWQ